MEGLSLTVTATTSSVTTTSSSYLQTCGKGKPMFLFSSKSQRVRIRALKCPRNSNKFAVFASKEDPKFDSLDQMEIKFGRLLGEDPKLTLAKIMGRKANPDASYMEIEKSFYKNKGKIVEVKEVPIDGLDKRQSLSSSDGLNLVRPVPKKGFEVKDDDKSIVSDTKRPRQSVGKAVGGIKRSVPNVILRKPSKFYEDDVEDNSSRLRIKPNLSLAIRNQQEKDRFSDMTLLRKPEPVSVEKNMDVKEEQSGNVSSFTLLEKPQAKHVNTVYDHFDSVEYSDVQTPLEGSVAEGPTGLQPHEQSVIGSSEEIAAEKEISSSSSADYDAKLSLEAALKGKPKILYQPMKEISDAPQSLKEQVDFENILVESSLEGHEDADWARAEYLVKKGYKGEVELISCSPRGFVASFGSLIGFLPYRNLAARWKFLAFESWLRQKGLDPSQYRPNLGIIGNIDASSTSPLVNSNLAPDTDIKSEIAISPDMKIEDLLRIYDNEKIKFLSSFVGQKLKVNILLANRKSRKLVFSLRPKEKEGMAEKKKSLMAKLQVGDVVKCCIKKITYFGIFVEVEGVAALIHQTEVSWDATLDPASYFKIGQIVDAKVHQLDFSLERIFLSLKEITPDPLSEALETVIGDRTPLDGRLEAAEATAEWPDVESIIKELQQIEGIQSVSKGRFFLSPGLAPTFQVYMASMFENQYKLLARSENKVQEVMVQTSLSKEELKTAILTCTNRVE